MYLLFLLDDYGGASSVISLNLRMLKIKLRIIHIK